MGIRVAVVGAGAGGLAAIRRFSAREELFQVVCFEQLPGVAGLWNYSDNITDPNHPTGSRYTAVYAHLKSNLPKEIMAFEDLQFPPHLPSFVSHVDVKNYLQHYAENFNLTRFIEFNKRVVNVVPRNVILGEDVWMVTIADVRSKVEEGFEFDAVVICNGHFFEPVYPRIEGMNLFEGCMMHSQTYRDPEEFKGKDVLIVGGGPSGVDLACEISEFARKTWLSHRKNEMLALPGNVKQFGDVREFTSDSAIFTKKFTKIIESNPVSCLQPDQMSPVGREVGKVMCGYSDVANGATSFEHAQKLVPHQSKCGIGDSTLLTVERGPFHKVGPIDVIIFCTGFAYSYPFLNADSGMAVLSPRSVGPLYKDLVCISRPTLSIIGLMSNVLPFSLFDCQAKFLVALLGGQIALPSFGKEMSEEMKKYNDLKEACGVDTCLSPLCFGGFQWFYVKDLARIAGFKAPSDCLEDLYEKIHIERFKSFFEYKDKEYKMGDEGFYVEV